MRFYTQTHRHYCGIDLHARSMYLCILDADGEVLLHRNMKSTPEAFLSAVAPYREELVVLRRRNHLMRKRADLLAHIQNTASQYNLPPLGTRVDRKGERDSIPAHFPDPVVRRSVELDLALIAHYDALLNTLEQELTLLAKGHDAFAYQLLRSIPGVGRILSLVMLYEIEDIGRFPRVQEFLSYARLVKAQRESAGKVHGHSGKKIGNAHLKWAFSEAAVLFLRKNPDRQRLVDRLAKKHGKGKALSILAARLGRTVYVMLKRREPVRSAEVLRPQLTMEGTAKPDA
ncbi:MAG TPA: transposase [Gammaproteobacteria bacterium]|nr:transposase [Gammaproteobacteria bacterium]